MTILDTIAADTRIRVAQDQAKVSPDQMKFLARSLGVGDGQRFYEAMARPGLSLICEVKKASPSRGIIDPVFDYKKIAFDYEAAGADAVSCLTEPRWFQGSDEIFREVRSQIRTPMLRKDFVVDEYQLYQARWLKADCVLLICALLDTAVLAQYLEICEQLGLAALVEAHDQAEIHSAVRAGARMIGVNNRNLKDFSVDMRNAGQLRDQIPAGILYVAESGVKTPEDARILYQAGADAILIGEALMRAPDRRHMLQQLREAVS